MQSLAPSSALTVSRVRKFLDDLPPDSWVSLQGETDSTEEFARLASAAGLKVVLNPSPIDQFLNGFPWRLVEVVVVNQLAVDFGLARTTVREALKLLEQEGYVVSRHGVGRFVTRPPSLARPLNRLEGVTDMLAAHGRTVEGTVVSHETIQPDESIAQMLGDSVHDGLVVRLIRSRGDGNNVLVYSVDYFVDPAPKIGATPFDGTGSLFAHLASAGVEIASASCDISAALLDAETSESLGIDPDQPWLLMVQQHLTSNGQPVLYSRDYHLGTEFSFQVVRTR